MHRHVLRHTFVKTRSTAGVDLRDVQIATRHADLRTTMRYDRAHKDLDRHPNDILAANMASVPNDSGDHRELELAVHPSMQQRPERLSCSSALLAPRTELARQRAREHLPGQR